MEAAASDEDLDPVLWDKGGEERRTGQDSETGGERLGEEGMELEEPPILVVAFIVYARIRRCQRHSERKCARLTALRSDATQFFESPRRINDGIQLVLSQSKKLRPRTTLPSCHAESSLFLQESFVNSALSDWHGWHVIHRLPGFLKQYIGRQKITQTRECQQIQVKIR